jgi:hypothetical protein
MKDIKSFTYGLSLSILKLVRKGKKRNMEKGNRQSYTRKTYFYFEAANTMSDSFTVFRPE